MISARLSNIEESALILHQRFKTLKTMDIKECQQSIAEQKVPPFCSLALAFVIFLPALEINSCNARAVFSAQKHRDGKTQYCIKGGYIYCFVILLISHNLGAFRSMKVQCVAAYRPLEVNRTVNLMR